MELFQNLFSNLLLFVYHGFDRIVINGYLSALTRPENAVYFFREILGVPAITKEVLKQRTGDYNCWVTSYARKRKISVEWAEQGVRKEDSVQRRLRRMEHHNQHGVYFIFKSMEQGQTFRSVLPKFHHRSPLPHPAQEPYPLHALLFLYPRRSPRPDGAAGRLVFPLPHDLLHRNFLFNRNFPIRKLFERSCDMGLWEMTAHKISELFGFRISKKLHGKLNTVLEQTEHGHHVFRIHFKNAFLRQYEKFATFLRNELCSNNLRDFALKKGLEHLAGHPNPPGRPHQFSSFR